MLVLLSISSETASVEQRHLLRLAVLEHCEIGLCQVGHVAAADARGRDAQRHQVDSATKRPPLPAGCGHRATGLADHERDRGHSEGNNEA
jgi:hypothetical protein